MHKSTHRSSTVEALEARIAPALLVQNPIADIIVGPASGGTEIDLSPTFDQFAETPSRTIVEFVTNFDRDSETAGVQPGVIKIELFDDLAPLTVQNFLSYALSKNARGDYEGTIFHRASPGFVLQGGGFTVGRGGFDHIPVGPEVHNEFSAERSNVRGTLAMAKVGLEQGGGPHSATSEFFFNVGDNASNLDNQNGGFTVFARVIEGMDVVDQIVALPLFGRSGDGTGTPVQNYDPDPDDNPQTPSPNPTDNQLITLAEVNVGKTDKGNAAGLTFEVVEITDAVTGQPTNLVSATLDGTDLQLKYHRGASGVANVKIRAADASTSETGEDTFSVTVKPNLIGDISGTLDGLIVGGDSGRAKVEITNNGGAPARGEVDVKVYLSRVGGADPTGAVLDESDLLVGELTGKRINLSPGKSTNLVTGVDVPGTFADAGGPQYRLIAQVMPSAGSTIPELFADDNVALERGLHRWVNQFGAFNDGQFGSRSNAALTVVEPDGDVVTFSLKGVGSGTLTQRNEEIDIQVSGTSSTSILKAAVADRGDQISIRNLEIGSAIGKVQLELANITGFIAASGGVRSMAFGDINSNSSLSIGSSGGNASQTATLSFGRIQDLRIESLMPIASVRAVEWLDTTGENDLIFAPSLKSLHITGAEGVRGDLEAGVVLTTQATFSSLSVSGVLKDATIRTNGSIGSVNVGALDHANFLVGATERPDELSDFAVEAAINRFFVRGVSDVSASFVDSQVAASRFGNIKIAGSIEPAGDAGDFGFVADAIKRYNRDGAPRLARLDAPGEHDRAGDYAVRIL